MGNKITLEDFAKRYAQECVENDIIPAELYDQFGVKRGLRDRTGKGVLTGLTNISRIDAFEEIDGKRVPCEGKLWYRGYNIKELVTGWSHRRFAYEEAAYLLLFGELPTMQQLEEFHTLLGE